MSAPTMTRPGRTGRRRVGALLSILVLLVTTSAACTGRMDPTSYGDGVREDFVEGCVAGLAPTDGTEDRKADENADLCGCIYDEMSDKETGIPFDDFKDAQSAIRKDPTDPENSLDKLIPEFDGFVDTCKGKTQAGPLPGD